MDPLEEWLECMHPRLAGLLDFELPQGTAWDYFAGLARPAGGGDAVPPPADSRFPGAGIRLPRRGIADGGRGSLDLGNDTRPASCSR